MCMCEREGVRMWLKGGVCVKVLQGGYGSSGEEAVPESVCAGFNVQKKHFTCVISTVKTLM